MTNSKILSEKNNPLLERKEIIIEINGEKTPSKEEVIKIINKDENLVVVKKINANFGRCSFIANVFVYNNEKAKNKIETIPKKIKKKIEEERKTKEAERLKEEKRAEEESKKSEENKEVKE